MPFRKEPKQQITGGSIKPSMTLEKMQKDIKLDIQREQIDYNDTFSSVLTKYSFRIIPFALYIVLFKG